MRVEKRFAPEFSLISRKDKPTRNRVSLDEPVVGISLIRDCEGFARKIVYSSGEEFSLDCSLDVSRWFAEKDPRIIFMDDIAFIDSLLKHYGVRVRESYRSAIMNGEDLYPTTFVRLGLRGRGFVAYDGSRVSKKVYYIRKFFPDTLFPRETDAESVRSLAQRLIDELKSSSLSPVNLWSPGGIVKGDFVKQGVRVYTSEVPQEALEYALDCAKTNWVSCFRLGTFPKAYDYDINSSFAYFLSTLVSCHPSNGKWIRSSEYHPEASYGFCRGLLTQRGFSPTMFRSGFRGSHNVQFSDFVGDCDLALAKPIIDFLYNSGVADFVIYDGWWFFPDKDVLPFNSSIQHFLNLRKKAKEHDNKYLDGLCKLINVSGTGVTIQTMVRNRKLVAGAYWNSVYASHVWAMNVAKVAELCLPFLDSLVSINVDGFVLDRPLPSHGLDPGDIKLVGSPEGEECVSAGDGRYWMPSRPSMFTKFDVVRASKKDSMTVYHKPSYFGLMEHCPFESVGIRNLTKEDVSLKEVIGGSKRAYSSSPKVWGDVLDNQYQTVSRKI